MNSTDHNQPALLKTQVQAKITSEQLSSEQLRNLMAMQLSSNNESLKKNLPTGRAGKYWLTSIATSLLVLMAIVSLWAPITSSPLLPDGLTQQQSSLAKQIAKEVVKNHIKLKPLDIQTQSITDIQQFFTQLDFSPVSSQQLVNPLLQSHGGPTAHQLLGGRYCSIKGVSAAQLRYQQNDNALSTLYQVGYDAKLFGDMPISEQDQPPQNLFVHGLMVSLWVEKDLLMVFVSNPQ